MNERDRNLYTAAQVRDIDRRAIVDHGRSGYALMQAAARACWAYARRRWPDALKIVVVCGVGNNGGDGYEIARLARADGCSVRVYADGAAPGAGDAARARTAWLADGGAIEVLDGPLPAVDLIVDALFGTGLSRPLDHAGLRAVQAINAARDAGAQVLAVDVPSGLDASRGVTPSALAVRADATVSFIARKFGLYSGDGPAWAGERHFDALDVPAAAYDGIAPIARLQGRDSLLRALPPRVRTAHKGDSGHVLLVGGNHSMMGAILIAGRAALHAGAGLVSVATRDEHAVALTAAQPELMCHRCETPDALQALMVRADVVAIGPGLGSDDWARSLFAAALASDKPLVVDADALNLLAATPQALHDAIITPHPGEAGRLLGLATREVQADRLAAVQALQARYGAAVVLKGAGTVVSGQPPAVCPYGNPGMAVGGMGDALTGIVAALRGAGRDAETAAQLGVLVHALAGDRAARDGERGLLPSDLIDALRAVVNPESR
ncbi:NAD(P)H-hydrate dehydratase [Solimonas marina]|uniref:Bifunctional NAD(P)H-hydrate repair enzyme n=1 Tax=Solimonas marina TaxID=2714601 RepID=A0A969W9L1_9GAMM|nr:NAD(P)H-hydrate dehydratase [Solimonas marina]NKF23276.1 NAD(P)H-hydrate dehydratase [Solimonas marina]